MEVPGKSRDPQGPSRSELHQVSATKERKKPPAGINHDGPHPATIDVDRLLSREENYKQRGHIEMECTEETPIFTFCAQARHHRQISHRKRK